MERLKKMDPLELAKFLFERGLERSLCDRLTGEGIDGANFINVNAVLLRACDFKAGEIMSILQHHPSNCDYDLKASDEHNSSTEEHEEEKRLDTVLSKYISPHDLSKLSHYEKRNNLSLLERWQLSQSHGMDNSDRIKPPFVRQKELDEKKMERKSQKTGSKKTPRTENKERTLVLRSAAKTTSMSAPDAACASSSSSCAPAFRESTSSSCAPALQVIACASTSSSCVPALPDAACVSTSSSCVPALPDVACASTSSSCVPALPDVACASTSSSSASYMPAFSNKRAANTAHSLFESSDSERETDVFETPTDIDWHSRILPNDFQEKIQKAKLLKMDLPQFDLEAILNSCYKNGKDGVRASILKLVNGEILNSKCRKMVFRILTNYLYFEKVENPKEVTASMKEGMARCFILTFPQYFSNLHDLPWAPIYDRQKGTGFLVNTSRRIQRNNRARQSKPKKRRLESHALEKTESFGSDEVGYLAVIMPGRVEKEEILSGMVRSFHKRQEDRNNGKTVTEMINKYPHLRSYEGEVLREEFRRLRPKAADMTKNFLQKLPSILKLPVQKDFHVGCSDDFLKALVLLSQHLPHDVRRKGETMSTSPQLSDIIVLVKVSDDLEEAITKRISSSRGPVQPYLIGLVMPSKKIMRHFLILDGQSMQLGGCSTVKAFEHLMMAYFVFNVNYPLGWRNTLHAIASLFYKVFEDRSKTQRSDSVTPSEHALWMRL